LATGSEDNKGKFPNPNLEHIFKTEDKMFELDTQIDNIEKSLKIIVELCTSFDTQSEADQAKYKFPCHLLNPLRFYWDTKFRKGIQEQYFKEGKLLKSKEMASLKKAFTDKLEFLRNHKSANINELKDQLRKNFTKSLDHKSCVYKHFIKKLMNHGHHMNIIKKISEDNNKKRRIDDDKYLLYGCGEPPKKHKQ
jgi:histone deacetylase complex regulatory component SIN3